MDQNLNIIANLQDNASAGLERLNGALGELGQGLLLGAAAAAGVAALVGYTKAAIDTGDALDNMAQRTGVSVEELSRLSYAAKLSDTSIEGIQTGFRMLSRSMMEAQDASSKQAAAFEEIGVATTNADGSLRNTNDVMEDLADVFKDMPDGARKTALAMQLLGKSGSDLIPYLNQGKEALQALKKEAEEFGVIWTPEQTKAAADFNDNIDRIKTAFEGLFTKLAQAVLPTVLTLSEALVSSAKDGGILRAVIDGLVVAFEGLNFILKPIWLGIYVITTAFATLGKMLGGVAAAVIAFMSGDFIGSKNIVTMMKDDLEKVGDELLKFHDNLMNDRPGDKAVINNEKTGKSFQGTKKDIKEAREELDKYLSSLGKELRDLGIGEKEKKLFELQDKAAELLKKGIPKAEIMDFIERGVKLIDEIDAKKVSIDVADRTKKIQEETEALAFENSLVEMSNEERKIAIELRQLEKDAMGASTEEVKKLTAERRKELEIQRDSNKLEELLKNTTDKRLEGSRENMIRLTKALTDGRIQEAQYLEAVQIEMERMKDKSKQTADEMTEFWKEAARGIQGAFSDFFFDFMQGKLGNLGDQIKTTIDRMVANMLAAQAATALFGNDFGKGGSGSMGGLVGAAGSFLSGMFGGMREGGGPVTAGKAYIVGEKRPELFVPSTNGYIKPDVNGASGGASVNLNITAMDSQDVMRALSKSKREIAAMLQNTTRSYNVK